MTEDSRRENAVAEARKGRASLAAACLLALGVDAATHSGLLTLFSKHLVKPGPLGADAARILASLLALRNQADYNRYFTMDEAGAREERLRAQGLVDALEAFLRARGCGCSRGPFARPLQRPRQARLRTAHVAEAARNLSRTGTGGS